MGWVAPSGHVMWTLAKQLVMEVFSVSHFPAMPPQYVSEMTSPWNRQLLTEAPSFSTPHSNPVELSM